MAFFFLGKHWSDNPSNIRLYMLTEVLLDVVRKGIHFCEVNGGYITAFTLLLPQIIINIRSAILNQ